MFKILGAAAAAISLLCATNANAGTRVLLEAGEITEPSTPLAYWFQDFNWTPGAWQITLVTDASVDWLAASTYARRHKHVDYDLYPDASYGILYDVYKLMTVTQTDEGYNFRFFVEGSYYRYFGEPGQGYSVAWADQGFHPEIQIDLSPAGASSSYAFYASAAPEPATWAMMILGFGAVGAMVRRRKFASANVPATIGV